ncbi:FAD-dependent oxidoreductase [Singulisphaera sp. PoT]|uniref:glycerol-3-phosphate dehydrogenase/oxidase n=1 Tax=Singulisphaera sp. PoT TaxID=3411797 RepID=UPI003BF4E506
MTRQAMIDRVRAGETWDIVVIGGGATGLGVAVDAVTRGYRTLLLESHDFAKGTSSRSTKLVHGGVRYLEQGRVGMVREALRERGLLRQNAPHLVHDMAFVVPAYNWWSRPYFGVGLKVYDLLSGSLGLGASRSIGRDETLARLPTLRPQGLQGGSLYYDGQFDDARLAIALLRTALDQGGCALNYCPVTSILHRNGQTSGVTARDAETGEDFEIQGRCVVNATGVFVDAIRSMDEPSSRGIIAPSRGIHVVLDRSFLPGDSALLIPRTEDGRVLFTIPWHDRVLLGTTDTPVDDIEWEPRPSKDDVAYLLEYAGKYLVKAPKTSDVLSQFAGLRPLLKDDHTSKTSKLSRELHLATSKTGLVTITGGKWTTYRLMAEQAVDQAVEVGGLATRPCVTSTWKLHGAEDVSPDEPRAVYGSDRPALNRLCAERPEWSPPLHPRLPYLMGEVVWAVRFESARTVEDVLARRTRALILDARASLDIAPAVASLMGQELGRDNAWVEDQCRAFQELVSQYLIN